MYYLTYLNPELEASSCIRDLFRRHQSSKIFPPPLLLTSYLAVIEKPGKRETNNRESGKPKKRNAEGPEWLSILVGLSKAPVCLLMHLNASKCRDFCGKYFK